MPTAGQLVGMATTARHLRPIVGSRSIGINKIRIPADLRLVDDIAFPRVERAQRTRAVSLKRKIQLAWFGLSVVRAAFLIAGSVFLLAGMHALALGGSPFGMSAPFALLSGTAFLTAALVWSILMNEPFARMPIATSTDDLDHPLFN
jgi:hypothetical protein